MGFRDREIAFDFKTALNEYVKYIDRSELASKLSSIDHLGGEETAAATADNEDDDESRARKHDHRIKQKEVRICTPYALFILCLLKY